MSEKSEKLPKITLEDIKITPNFVVSRANEVPVVAADFIKCMIDLDIGLATLLLYRRHVIPKTTEKEILADTIVDELFLEIKVPLNTFFATILYAYETFNRIRKGEKRGVHIGPAAIKEVDKH